MGVVDAVVDTVFRVVGGVEVAEDVKGSLVIGWEVCVVFVGAVDAVVEVVV